MAEHEQLILNVDDTDAARYARTRILTKAGLRVVEAASGTEALALARELKPALILLDVKLPDINGMEVCARLKADPATSFILVLQTSASYIGVADKIRALEGGADNYLFEPIEPAELLANVHALLRLAKVENELRLMDKRKDEFLAILAHELRNPLVPIRNAVEILNVRAPDAPEWELRARHTISRHLDHMVRLVNDLLDVSRLSHNKLALQSKRVAVTDLLQSAGDSVRQLVDKKHLQFSIRVTDGPLDVIGDEVRLVQVLANLMHNAAKFTREGGAIRVTAAQEDAHVVIRVTDNGIGISPDRLQDIFGMFAQANAIGHDRQDGLGIGLSLAKNLVELHGGTLKAASDGIGCGTTLTIELPMASADVAAPVIASEPSPVASGESAERLRVLVVDDHADVADTMRELIEILGHTAETAYSGTDGMRRAREWQPDVVMLDIGLKDMTGYDLIRMLRDDPATRDAFLLACSGFSGDENKQKAVDAGVDDYLVKPVSIDRLTDLFAQRLAAFPAKPD